MESWITLVRNYDKLHMKLAIMLEVKWRESIRTFMTKSAKPKPYLITLKKISCKKEISQPVNVVLQTSVQLDKGKESESGCEKDIQDSFSKDIEIVKIASKENKNGILQLSNKLYSLQESVNQVNSNAS